MGPPAVWRYRPSLPEELGGLVLRLVAGNPRSRPESVAQVAAELARMAELHRWAWTPPERDPVPGADEPTLEVSVVTVRAPEAVEAPGR